MSKNKDIAKKLADYGIEEAQFSSLATVLKNFLHQVIPESVRDFVAGGTVAIVENQLDMVSKHGCARAALADVCDGMTTITEWATPTAAIDEWVANRVAEVKSHTCFAKLLELSERVEVLAAEVAPCADGVEGDDDEGLFDSLSLEFKFSDGDGTNVAHAASLEDFKKFTKNTKSEPLIAHAYQSLQSSFNTIIQASIQSINLGLIQCPPGGNDCKRAGLRLYHPEARGDSQNLGKTIGSGTKCGWLCDYQQELVGAERRVAN